MPRLNLSPDVLALNPGAARAITIGGDKRSRVPRADTNERTGLRTLIEAGWSVESVDSVRYRLYKFGTDLDTGMCASEKAACDKAKELSK